jgi:hypothetical protein
MSIFPFTSIHYPKIFLRNRNVAVICSQHQVHLLCPLPIDARQIEEGLNDKAQIPAFYACTNRIRFLGFIHIAEALQIKAAVIPGNIPGTV